MSKSHIRNVCVVAALTAVGAVGVLAATTSANAGEPKSDVTVSWSDREAGLKVPGSEILAYISLGNQGAPASGVRVVAALPAGIEFRDVKPHGSEENRWDCSATTVSKLDCSLLTVLPTDPELPWPGTSLDVKLAVTDKVRAGIVKIPATVTTTTPDANSRNNRASLSVQVSTTTGTFTGRVWEDTNRNGLQDAGEPGIAGALVEANESWDSNARMKADSTAKRAAKGGVSAASLPTPSAITDAQGRYTLTNVPAFIYRVAVYAEGRQDITKFNVGLNDKIDSDFDPRDQVVERFYSPPTKLQTNGVKTLDLGYLPVS